MREIIVCGIFAVFFLFTIPLRAQESSPTDDIVVKATNAVIFQMTANLKLTQEQMRAVGPIIADNIVKMRALQQSLEDGTIDSQAMYIQRKRLSDDENQGLSQILTPDQMKVWKIIQNQSESHSKEGSSK